MKFIKSNFVILFVMVLFAFSFFIEKPKYCTEHEQYDYCWMKAHPDQGPDLSED